MSEEPTAPEPPAAPPPPAAETGGESPAAAAKPAAEPAAKPKPPPRELPSQEEIAAWIGGAELPSLANLFNLLVIKRYDALVMQIRKAELVPQHWQVISGTEAPDESLFDGLPSVAKLRLRYRDPELAARRLAALQTAWRELRGRQPSLWTVPDLFAALRRIIDKKLEIDFYDLLTATRDVWRDVGLPSGAEQLEILWASLSFIRDKTKK